MNLNEFTKVSHACKRIHRLYKVSGAINDSHRETKQ